MDPINPYASPAATEAPILADAPAPDLLLAPSRAYCVFGVLGIIVAVPNASLSIHFMSSATELGNEGIFQDALELLVATTWVVVLSVMWFITSWCCYRRRHRWVVVAISIITITPLAGWFPSPLGIITLMRLWRKEVWASFK